MLCSVRLVMAVPLRSAEGHQRLQLVFGRDTTVSCFAGISSSSARKLYVRCATESVGTPRFTSMAFTERLAVVFDSPVHRTFTHCAHEPLPLSCRPSEQGSSDDDDALPARKRWKPPPTQHLLPQNKCLSSRPEMTMKPNCVVSLRQRTKSS